MTFKLFKCTSAFVATLKALGVTLGDLRVAYPELVERLKDIEYLSEIVDSSALQGVNSMLRLYR
jgi:hypothetical protein